MSRIFRLPSGTLEFRRTEHGLVIVMNGEHYFSLEDMLIELLDGYYRRNLSHPGGSSGYLEELTGLDMRSGCPLCDAPALVYRCPICSIGRCLACAATHDHSALCQQTRECAEVHRQFRGGTDLDEHDWYFARRQMALSFIRRRLQ